MEPGGDRCSVALLVRVGETHKNPVNLMMVWGKLFSRAHRVPELTAPRNPFGVQSKGPSPFHKLWVFPNRLSQAGNRILLEPSWECPMGPPHQAQVHIHRDPPQHQSGPESRV